MVKTVFVTSLGGANAINKVSLTGATIYIKRGIPAIGAVWAQEYYEAKFKQSLSIFTRTFRKSTWTKGMEVFSHEIESHVASQYYGRDENFYRHKEAIAMTQGYPEFRNNSVDEVYALMEAHKVQALIWIDKNRLAIEKFIELAKRD